MSWSVISHNDRVGAKEAPDSLLQRLRSEDSFVAKLRDKMHPGMVVVVTDAPLHPDTRSGKDFVHGQYMPTHLSSSVSLLMRAALWGTLHRVLLLF